MSPHSLQIFYNKKSKRVLLLFSYSWPYTKYPISVSRVGQTAPACRRYQGIVHAFFHVVFIPGLTRGRHGDRAFLRASAGNVLRLYPHRQLRLLNLLVQADQVVLEQDWQGTAAAAFGNLHIGDQTRFPVASFFTLADGLIIRQTDYVIPIPLDNGSDTHVAYSVDQ